MKRKRDNIKLGKMLCILPSKNYFLVFIIMCIEDLKIFKTTVRVVGFLRLFFFECFSIFFTSFKFKRYMHCVLKFKEREVRNWKYNKGVLRYEFLNIIKNNFNKKRLYLADFVNWSG